MKDLKHLIYFEDLLQEANNELVAQAQKEGMKCIGYMCENVPEPLLNLPGCFSARLRAPRTGSIDVGTYYLTSFLCEYSRAILERALEGGYNFLDAVITPDGCTMLNRCVENMDVLQAMGKDKKGFFFDYMEIPMKADYNGLNNSLATPSLKPLGAASLSAGQLVRCKYQCSKSQVRNSTESRHEHTHETDVGEILDRTELPLVISQWNHEVVPCSHLDFTITGVNFGHTLIGDIVPTHQHRVGMDSNAILEITLILIKRVIIVDVLGIGR